MLQLKPNYVTDSENKKVAVQLNIRTYEKIEEILENYSLFHLLKDDEGEIPLGLQDAHAFYDRLKKKK